MILNSFIKRKPKLLYFPIIFGILGALMGLFLRYLYTGGVNSLGLSLKNILHSHSHVMLLGFVLNALLSFIWIHFTAKIDKTSYSLYLILQGTIGLLLIGFAFQGYAIFTIVFSTLHLWISYALLIRLWKRLKSIYFNISLIKIGIVFHFIASIGPYILGPLKVLGLEDSSWYQQCIFFYLHFQYFGSFFIWMLAILFERIQIQLSKRQIILLVTSIVLLFAHSLTYSFQYIALNITGGIGALLLLNIIYSLKFQFLKQKRAYILFYFVLLFILILNTIGSIPFFSNLVAENRFLLIAWFHLLFLGLYLPFIWIQLPIRISPFTWSMYLMFFIFTEILLTFPTQISNFSNLSIMTLLFIGYFGVVFSICIVHLSFLFETNKNELTKT